MQICFYTVYAIYLYLNPEVLPSETIPFLGWNASLTLISLATIIFALVTFFDFFHVKRKTKQKIKEYCLFTSISSAKCLESGDKVRAAFYAEKFFRAFPIFTGNTKFEIGPWKTSLAEVFEHDIKEFYYSRKAIGPTIMKGETLSDEFYSLADQLFSKDAPSNYDIVQESLRKIIESTKPYRRKELTFFDKHPKLKGTLAELSEYVKLTIVLIISFILWLIFGYAK